MNNELTPEGEVGLIENKPSLNPALYDYWTIYARYYVLYGGRASGKSHDAAGMLVIWAAIYKIRVVCCSQFLNRSGDSIYTLLKSKIEYFGLSSRYEIQSKRIYCKTTGSELFFYGLWKNIDEVKGLEGIDICLLEEAHNLTKEQFYTLNNSFRKKGFMFIVIFNPRLVTDFVWQYFVVNTPAKCNLRKINYQENPFLEQEYIQDVIEPLKTSSPEDYAHHFLGEPLADDESAIIKRSWLMAAIDAHIKLGIEPRGAKILGFDVADGSDNPNDKHDECALVEIHGSVITWCDVWRAKSDEMLESSTRAWNVARERGNTLIIYDSIGVGAACGNHFNNLNAQNRGIHKIAHQKFPAGGAPLRPSQQYGNTGIKNRDYFANIKAQSTYNLATRFMNTYNAVTKGHKYSDADMLFLSSDMPNLERLIDELSIQKKMYDAAGRIMVEPKKDLIKRGIKSPNLNDAAVMACSPIRPMSISPNIIK